jgi:hypothetical protein
MGFGVEGHFNLVVHDVNVDSWRSCPEGTGRRESNQE